MASLESVLLTPHRCDVADGRVVWSAAGGSPIEGVPQICWANGKPWREVNLWLYSRAAEKDIKLQTIVANATALHAYAQWLEQSSAHWWDFPPRRADRCLIRYRGSLIEARDKGALAPSTASARMRVVVHFYRWLYTSGLLSPEWPMWRDRIVGIRLDDPVGFERTISVQTTDLAIPNRARPGERLEDGVVPVSSVERDAILGLTKSEASQELYLMLALGFFTGMRLGTICDLKVQTLFNAVSDPAEQGLWRLAIGPGASPPVQTKFGVTGQAIIPKGLLEAVREYAYSVRRLRREAKAESENRNLVFLTRYGNAYARRGTDKSASVNVEIHQLKKFAVAHGIAMQKFRFHQSRATFATTVAEIAIKLGGAINAVALVRDLLLHKDEATSLKYIKFVQKSPIKTELANEFTRQFLGTVALARQSAHA